MSGFTVFLSIVVGAAFLIWFGYALAADRASAKADAERDDLNTQRQMLDTEWKALKQAQRVNGVFFAARDAMRQAEAEAAGYGHGRRGQPGSGYGPRVVDGQWE